MYEPVQGWEAEVRGLHARIAPHFERAEPRRQARFYVQAQLGSAARKNDRQLAEQAEDLTPDGMQCLLNAAWDAEEEATDPTLRADRAATQWHRPSRPRHLPEGHLYHDQIDNPLC